MKRTKLVSNVQLFASCMLVSAVFIGIPLLLVVWWCGWSDVRAMSCVLIVMFWASMSVHHICRAINQASDGAAEELCVNTDDNNRLKRGI